MRASICKMHRLSFSLAKYLGGIDMIHACEYEGSQEKKLLDRDRAAYYMCHR